MSSFQQPCALSEEPSAELCREVYAHYGLCMQVSQIFETHLINILTAYATDRDPEPTRQTYSKYQEKHEKLTFGQLIKSLAEFDYLSGVSSVVISRKIDRDFLAHRFFRDRADFFMTVGGCKQLIRELELMREEFDSALSAVEAIQTELTGKLGLHTAEFDQEVRSLTGQWQAEQKTFFTSSHASGQTTPDA